MSAAETLTIHGHIDSHLANARTEQGKAAQWISRLIDDGAHLVDLIVIADRNGMGYMELKALMEAAGVRL